MARIFFATCAIIGLAACASAPVNFGKPGATSRIGMVFLIDEYPKHSHVGTTAFQNFDTPNASETNFRARFEEKCMEVIGSGSFELKTVEPTELLREQRLDLFSYASSDVFFEPQIKNELNRLATEEGLDFVIVVYPVSGPAWVNSAAYIDGYGLYTECRFGNCKAQALSYVSARIYDVANRSSLKGAGFRFFQNAALPDSIQVEDPKQIDPGVVDTAANLALESFVPLFEGMMRTSEFID